MVFTRMNDCPTIQQENNRETREIIVGIYLFEIKNKKKKGGDEKNNFT